MTRTRTAYTSMLACSAVYVAVVLALTLSSFLFFYGYRGYISDEIYYVPAGVKILTKLLGPWHSLSHVYTVNARTFECLYSVLPPGSRIERVYTKGIPGVVVELHQRVEDDGGCVLSIYPVPMPDSDIRYNGYYNLEHPPLVKYLMGAVAYLTGNNRLPRILSYIMGMVIAGAIGFLAASAGRPQGCIWLPCLAGLVAVVLLGIDGSFRAMTSIAMLDIYASAFSILSVVSLLSGRIDASAVLMGLAAASKYPGAFPLPIVLYYVYRSGGTRRVARYFLIAAVTFATTFVPLIAALGPSEVFRGTFLRGTSWLLTYKADPRAISVVGLLAGERVFIHFSMGGFIMASKPLWELTVLPWIIGIFIVVAGVRDSRLLVLLGSQVSVIAGFAAVYLVSRTLYSYYAVIISTFGAALLAYEAALAVFLIPKLPALTRAIPSGRGEERGKEAEDRGGAGLDAPGNGARG